MRHLWLQNRAQRRSDICRNFLDKISSMTGNFMIFVPFIKTLGMNSILSDQKPSVRSAIEEPDDDDLFGNGEPPEIKEFIEELGESTPEVLPRSTPLLLGLPLMILLGCLTVSTALWRDIASLFDLLLLSTPLGENVE